LSLREAEEGKSENKSDKEFHMLRRRCYFEL